MIVVIDNYDSFTYNLVQYLGEMVDDVRVFRNDQTTPQDVLTMRPEAVVISPGPCTPKEAGISTPLITALAGKVPILGVCLGHQCIGAAFGARVIRGKGPVHGKTSEIRHDGRSIYLRVASPLVGTRYHSLIIERETLPDVLEVSAELEDGTIMGVRHKELPIEGVQFHPESVLTAPGKDILRNFLRLAGVEIKEKARA
ncbi:MAG: aminodeoxychorismate/anthranilate synthase component II [Armatimonadetes bacterium]|nr:aminodeoxychorismate/anthranilate synthase component II [Armatimonadota bacterium]MBI2972811.1 aminodeoxychorismate/anthranilate synthase component II [Armatimonadota bacterium]